MFNASKPNTKTLGYLVISSAQELLRISEQDIVYILAEGNYSTLLVKGGEKRLVTLQLGQIERLIAEQIQDAASSFIRIGRSLIINKDSVFFINLSSQQLVLSDGANQYHTLKASKEALKELKDLMEREIKL